MPPYMIIGAGSGIVLYLAKYTLYGVALLLGPGRDKYAAAAIEIDLNTIPQGLACCQSQNPPPSSPSLEQPWFFKIYPI